MRNNYRLWRSNKFRHSERSEEPLFFLRSGTLYTRKATLYSLLPIAYSLPYRITCDSSRFQFFWFFL